MINSSGALIGFLSPHAHPVQTTALCDGWLGFLPKFGDPTMQATRITLPANIRPQSVQPVSISYNIGPRMVGSWRGQAIGMWRIVFGIVWASDATFKWQLAFQKDFVSYLTGRFGSEIRPRLPRTSGAIQ
jgi:hypothetical protein